MHALSLLMAVLKAMPDTAVSRSLENAKRAEAAAKSAIEHGYGISVKGTTLMITEPSR